MRFIESILLKDGIYHNIDLHQNRVDAVFDKYGSPQLSHDLMKILPAIKLEGTFKVRMIYDMDTEDAEYDIEYAAYHPRKIESLQVISSARFDYSLKYENRNKINALLNQSHADDIIIAMDGFITDGSYYNLAFWNGCQWVTPNTPLLKGVRRSKLLMDQQIIEESIRIDDIRSFEKVSLINAMLDLGEYELPIAAIDIPKNDG